MPRSSHPVPALLAAIRIAFALAALLGSMRATPGAAQFIEPLDVIAQGVVELPAEPLAWRAREISFPTGYDSSAPGFVTSQGPDFVVRVGAENAVAVGLEEAAFMAPGPRRIQPMRANSDGGTALEFSIVPAGEANELAGNVIDVSEAFTLPKAGFFDVEFITGRIPAGGTAWLPGGSGPVLVMAMRGGVQVEPQAAPFHRLEEGEFVLVENWGHIRANDGPAHESSWVIVLRIGLLDSSPPAPIVSAPPPTPDSSEPATIHIESRLCPPRTPEHGLSISCRTRFSRFEYLLDGSMVNPSATDDQGRLIVRDVTPGAHLLSADGYVGHSWVHPICTDQNGSVVSRVPDGSKPGSRVDATKVDVAPGARIDCIWFVVLDDARAAQGTASVAIVFTRCPIGYEGAGLASDCTDPVDGLFLSLDGPTAASGTTTAGEVGFTGLWGASLYELTAGIEAWDRAMLLDCRDADGAQVASPIDQHTSGIAVPAGGAVSCLAYAMDAELWWSLVQTPGATSP